MKYNTICYKVAFAVTFFCAIPGLLSGQGFNENLSPYFNLKQHYGFIDYAINSGMIELDHVPSQPYLAGELYNQFNVCQWL